MYTPEAYVALMTLLKSEGYRFVSFEAVSSEVAAERVICSSVLRPRSKV